MLGDVDGLTRPVHVVETGVWQAARSMGDYTLVACTVGPGFEFADFAMLKDDAEAADQARRKQPAAADFI